MDYVTLVFLDLTTAFDKVGHKILVVQLQHFVDFSCSALQWFILYLADRPMCVSLAFSDSHPIPLSYGVPSIHLSIHLLLLIRGRVTGEATEAGKTRVPSAQLLIPAILGGSTKVFPGQPGYVVPPACPGSSRGPCTRGTCPERLMKGVSGKHPDKMPVPPHLVSLNSEE